MRSRLEDEHVGKRNILTSADTTAQPGSIGDARVALLVGSWMSGAVTCLCEVITEMMLPT